jgi:hypothetical protein
MPVEITDEDVLREMGSLSVQLRVLERRHAELIEERDRLAHDNQVLRGECESARYQQAQREAEQQAAPDGQQPHAPAAFGQPLAARLAASQGIAGGRVNGAEQPAAAR